MQHPYLQKTTIFIISLILGLIGIFQWRSISEKEKNDFQENNPLREMRIILEGNNKMKEQIVDSKEKLLQLKTDEEIGEEALDKIERAKEFSGIDFNKNQFLEVLIEGNASIKQLIEIINTFWNAGARNISLNGIAFSFESSGLDQAGGQVLLGGIPLSSPYLFEIFGDTESLVKVLDPTKGSLERFQTKDIKITLSTKEDSSNEE